MLAAELRVCVSECECELFSSLLQETFSRRFKRLEAEEALTDLEKKLRLSSRFLHGGEGRGQGIGRQQRPRLDPLSSLQQTRASAGHGSWHDDLPQRWRRRSHGESCCCCRLRVSLLRWAGQQPDVTYRRAHCLPTFTAAPSAVWNRGAGQCGWKWSTGWARVWGRGGCIPPLCAAHQPVRIHLAHIYLLC